MGILTELAKRAALKTAIRAAEIPTQAERTVGALVPKASSPLAQVAKEVPTLTPRITPEGLESPSRRKFLKQTASTAARASVPDRIAQPLMSYAAKKLVLTPEVDTGALGTGIRELLYSGNLGDELYDIGSSQVYGDIVENFISHTFPKDQLPSLNSAFNKLKNLANHEFTYELPDGSATSHSADLGSDLFGGELSKVLKGEPNENAYVEEILPALSAKVQELGFTPDELKAIEKLDQTLPRSMEEMDTLVDPTKAPYNSTPEELQQWIFDQEGNWRGLD